MSQLRSPVQSRVKLAISAGFTVVELVLTVAVLGILTSITVPSLYLFMRQRDIRNEQVAQLEIAHALRAYDQQNLLYPDDTPYQVAQSNSNFAKNWFAKLAPYTKLSMHNLEFDVWGNERRYVMKEIDTVIQGTTVPVYYATVISAGPDAHVSTGCGNANVNGTFTQSSATGGAINGFVLPDDATQWRNQTDPLGAFSADSCGGAGRDELLTKITNLPDQVVRYKTTVRRLGEVTVALEAYNHALQAEAVLAYQSGPTSVKNGSGVVTLPSRMIYYPRGTSTGQTDDPASNYDSPVISATCNANNSLTVCNILNSTNTTQRYGSLVALMRQLGLPDSDCCSALSQFVSTADGQTYQTPFYYASNPRAVISAGNCGPRLNPAAGNSTLPARVSTLPPTDPYACY